MQRVDYRRLRTGDPLCHLSHPPQHPSSRTSQIVGLLASLNCLCAGRGRNCCAHVQRNLSPTPLPHPSPSIAAPRSSRSVHASTWAWVAATCSGPSASSPGCSCSTPASRYSPHRRTSFDLAASQNPPREAWPQPAHWAAPSRAPHRRLPARTRRRPKAETPVTLRPPGRLGRRQELRRRRQGRRLRTSARPRRRRGCARGGINQPEAFSSLLSQSLLVGAPRK